MDVLPRCTLPRHRNNRPHPLRTLVLLLFLLLFSVSRLYLFSLSASLDEVQSKLADLEKEDVDGLKTKITTLTQELADEKEARAKEAKQTELRDKVKDFLSDKKFVNAITEDSIRSQMIQKLEEENGKNAEDVFKELTTKDGKPIENILVDEKKVPDVKIPNFTTKFNSGEQKKGTQKLREMSLDDRMKLKAEDPDYYATLLNDR